MDAGYSGTPLLKKLGLKPGLKAAVLNPSPALLAALKAEKQTPKKLKDYQSCPVDQDFIHIFLKERAALEGALPFLKGCLAQAGMIWVSWPKKASKVATEIDEAMVRATGLQAGLVDIKICAVDEVWSGLKFVIPVKDRR